MADYIVTRTRTDASIRSGYKAAWVSTVKAEIPSYARSWDGDSKMWTVAEPYVERVIAICHRYGSVAVNDLRKPVRAQVTQRDWAESMFSAIPPHLHKDVYRKLALVLHPDQGGDVTTMQQLTRAWDKRPAA